MIGAEDGKITTDTAKQAAGVLFTLDAFTVRELPGPHKSNQRAQRKYKYPQLWRGREFMIRLVTNIRSNMWGTQRTMTRFKAACARLKFENLTPRGSTPPALVPTARHCTQSRIQVNIIVIKIKVHGL